MSIHASVANMNRNIALDILKLVLAFMVVGLHAGFLHGISSLGEYLTVNGLFRIAVPIYLLINGFHFYPVLVEKKVAGWIRRVACLYAFWMMVYAYFWFRPSEISFNQLLEILHTIIFGYFQLWYLPGLIGAALVIYALERFWKKLLPPSIFILFLIGVAIQYVVNYEVFGGLFSDGSSDHDWIHKNFLFFSFPFFGIGYLINKFGIDKKITLRQLVISSVAGCVLLFGESYFNYVGSSLFVGFDNLASLLIVCPSIFLLFTKIHIRGESKNISLYASGIYLVHAFFLNAYRKYTHFDGTMLTLVVIMSSIPAVYLLIMINKKINQGRDKKINYIL